MMAAAFHKPNRLANPLFLTRCDAPFMSPPV